MLCTPHESVMSVGRRLRRAPRPFARTEVQPCRRHRVVSSPKTETGFEAVVREPCHVRRFLDEAVPRADVEHIGGIGGLRGQRLQLTDLALHRDPGPSADHRHAGRGPRALRGARVAARAGAPGEEAHGGARTGPALRQGIALHRGPGAALSLSDGRAHEARRHQPGGARSLVRAAGAAERWAAVQLLATSAHAMGYAACWTCAPIVAGERLEELLEVRPPARLVALVRIGRPAGLPAAHKRLPLDQVLSFR